MIILYHGTPNIWEVLEEGLIPNKDRRHESSIEGCVYLAREPSLAASFGKVVEVELPNDAPLDWDPELEGSAVIHEGEIPPERLELYTGDTNEPTVQVKMENEPLEEPESEPELFERALREETRSVTEVIETR